MGFSLAGLSVQVIEIAVFVPLILFGLSRAGGWLLHRVEREEDAHFVLMLGIMAVTGAMASAINLPDIAGTFLAGLAVNGAVEDKSSKEKLGFIGKTLFIPNFFIMTSLLIDSVEFAPGRPDAQRRARAHGRHVDPRPAPHRSGSPREC